MSGSGVTRGLARCLWAALSIFLSASAAVRADELPLAPSRQLQFSTDEGTWLSVDVSPDGRHIVFDLLGDLYSLPIAGGRATRLRGGMPFDSQPRYSPDGRWIAFISDADGADNVWVVDATGGQARQITREHGVTFMSPEWAPDSRSIVVSRAVGESRFVRFYQLFEYSLDGSSRQLTGIEGEGSVPAPARIVTGAAFGTDPKRIYCALRLTTGLWNGYGNWQLATANRDTGELTQITHESASAFRPIVSADGRWLAYGTRVDNETTLKLVELASGTERVLLTRMDRDEQDGWAFTRDVMPGAAFVPDGSALILAHRGKLWRLNATSGELSPIPFTAAVDLGLGPVTKFDRVMDNGPVIARRIENPRLSPDGKQVVFSALGRLWIQDVSGSAVRQLKTGPDAAYFPTWSPNGRDIAFVTWDDVEGGEIWRTSARGDTSPRRLSSVRAYYSKLEYSPDGRRLLAVQAPAEERLTFFDAMMNGSRPQTPQLVWLPASGGRSTVIARLNPGRPRTAAYGRPHFSKNDGYVYFTDPVDGLSAVRWDGSERHALLRVEGPEAVEPAPMPADEVLLSPDGTRVAALQNNQVWLIDRRQVPNPGAVITLGEAAAPGARKISDVGADFIDWSADGTKALWAIGRTLFTADVASGSVTTRETAVQMPRDTPKGLLALRGARLITMRGDEVIERGDLLIEDNRIVAIGAAGSLDIPAGARSIDVTGKTILPGYVDVHAHMWPSWGTQRTSVYQYLANLAYGVTTTRDPQTTTSDVFSYSDRVAIGDILGPRIFSTGPGIFPAEHIGSLAQMRMLAERYATHYHSETIKDYYITRSDRRMRQWLVMAAREQRLSPTAEGNSDFKAMLTRVIDGYAGQEHTSALGPMYKDVITLLARSNIAYTPTLLSGQPRLSKSNLLTPDPVLREDAKLRRFTPLQEIERVSSPTNFAAVEDAASQAAAILHAGGNVALGSHGTIPQGLSAQWTLWLLASAGMTPHEALRAATIGGAQAIGHEQDLGSLDTGKLADLQVLDRDPLRDIRNSLSIVQVMVNGRLFDAATLDEVWPRQRPLRRQYWWPTP